MEKWTGCMKIRNEILKMKTWLSKHENIAFKFFKNLCYFHFSVLQDDNDDVH